MKGFIFLLGLVISDTCRERKSIYQDNSAYFAALKQLNSGPVPTKWHQLTLNQSWDSFTPNALIGAIRLYLYDVETALQDVSKNVTIPFWEPVADDPVFEASQFGVSSEQNPCVNSVPFANFKKLNGECLKHVKPTGVGANYKLIENLPTTVKNRTRKFFEAHKAILTYVAYTIFMTNDLLDAVQDPLFLSVLARTDASVQAFLEIDNFHTKLNSSAEVEFKSGTMKRIIPWNVTLAEIALSYNVSCVTYKF